MVGREDRDGLTKPRAFVVLKAPAADVAALGDELKEHVKQRIGVWKYPRWIEFVDSLPKTATGKSNGSACVTCERGSAFPHALMTRSEIILDGRRLETAMVGAGRQPGPTLVLLHEGLGCVALWRDVPERLAAETGCGVFAYSRFGYGQSDPVPLPPPMDLHARRGADRVAPRAGRGPD